MARIDHSKCGTSLLGCMTVLLALGGCTTNLGPVRDFAAESKKLGTTFRAMPEIVVESCRSDQVLGQQMLNAAIPFRLTEVSARADQVCGPLVTSQADILPVAQLLEQYGDALAALADEKLPDYTVQTAALQSSIATLKDESGQPVLSASRTEAVLALARFLGRLTTERAARREIRALLDQQEGVRAATTALSWYATRIYRHQLSTYATNIDATTGGKLVMFEKTEPLAARATMMSLAKERQRVDELVKAADTFVAAATKLDASRAEVRARLDRPGDKEALKQLLALAQEVRLLRKQLRDADD